ncbi:pilus assembly protein [Chitinimonas sp. PSY-7]|uniref:PilC/PilY family type IV pilus protein n=1 Tax=Chitinimonas sp. PSY-7 TaxID=3459088 RepID=UPI00404015AC
MRKFKIKPLCTFVGMAFLLNSVEVLAAEPYPSLPPTLSTSVAPNIVLLIDNSASMLQDSQNQWMRAADCYGNPDANWPNCINYNVNQWRTNLDSATITPNTKMNIAKRVATSLIKNNQSLGWGIFSFDVKDDTTIGGNERTESGILRNSVLIPEEKTYGTSNLDILTSSISNIKARTATPLGEAMLEVTRYFAGDSSYYSKISGNYTSPIKYRCQKNFVIVITDGDASGEDNLPGSGRVALPYITYDSSNKQVNKNFSVCTAASADCPAVLEGATVARDFGNTGNRFRALRDVVKYAADADFKTSGFDLDGKSFNDEAFKKQSLQTYTIGFGVTNEVLPAAATVGGGKYFTADNEASLTAALTDAVSGIKASISNAGGLAVESAIKSASNYVYQPVFNPDGWYGELRRYPISEAGVIDLTTKVEAGAILNARNVSSIAARKIYSAKTESGVTKSFEFNDSAGLTAMLPAQKTLLGTTTAEQQQIIRFLRGSKTEAGLRTRVSLLGDIIDSQPVFVGPPVAFSTDPTYESFKAAQKSRGMVFIGANDGMMHGFNTSQMSEVVGYIPSMIYPKLKTLANPEYGKIAAPHVYHVNGNTVTADIKVGSDWRTLLVGGLGQGGQGYFALDVTSEVNFANATDTVKWEWNDQKDTQVGYSFGTPIIYNVRTSSLGTTPAVILTNGYENDYDDTAVGGKKAATKSSALYILNAATGALIKKIDLPAGSTGLSSPAGLDDKFDGILDYVYAGDENGNMWRFDLTSTDPAQFKVASSPIFKTPAGQPIIQRPAVLQVLGEAAGSGEKPVRGNLILFGTGKLLTDADRLTTTMQAFYGVLDIMDQTPITVDMTKLVEQKIDATATATATDQRSGSYRHVTDNVIDLKVEPSLSSVKGWYMNLPVPTERLVSSPLVFSDKVIFGTGITQSNEKCLPGGKGWIMGLDPLTGSTVRYKDKKYSFVDVNKSGRSDSGDALKFGTETAYASGYEVNGIPTETSFISNTNPFTDAANVISAVGGVLGAGAGSGVALKESNTSGVYTTYVVNNSASSGVLLHCEIGSEKCESNTILPPAKGVRIERATWRELM